MFLQILRLISMTESEAIAEVERLKNLRKRNRKKTYAKSRLDKYRGDIVMLLQGGATAVDIQKWLRERRIKVVLSTVTRYLDKHELR